MALPIKLTASTRSAAVAGPKRDRTSSHSPSAGLSLLALFGQAVSGCIGRADRKRRLEWLINGAGGLAAAAAAAVVAPKCTVLQRAAQQIWRPSWPDQRRPVGRDQNAPLETSGRRAGGAKADERPINYGSRRTSLASAGSGRVRVRKQWAFFAVAAKRQQTAGPELLVGRVCERRL